jgi:hypothetical protein
MSIVAYTLTSAGMKFREKRSSGMVYQHILAHFEHCCLLIPGVGHSEVRVERNTLQALSNNYNVRPTLIT